MLGNRDAIMAEQNPNGGQMQTSNSTPWKQICDLYRNVCLNVRYYGHRADSLAKWNKLAQITAAVASSATLVAVVKEFGRLGEPIRIVLAVIATVAAVAMPVLTLSERAKDFEKLHFIYSELCAQIDVLMSKVRREGTVCAEDIAALSVLQQLYGHLASLDEPNPDRKLVDRFEAAINRASPPESLWLEG